MFFPFTPERRGGFIPEAPLNSRSDALACSDTSLWLSGQRLAVAMLQLSAEGETLGSQMAMVQNQRDPILG